MIIKPAMPAAFFNSKEHPTIISKDSENIFPTTGTKVPIANFAVRMEMPSNVEVMAPCMVNTPTKIVKTKANTM
jgi:hypothetical protein